MNGSKYLLDTNIIIGLLKNDKNVLLLIENYSLEITACAYSSITRMELLGYPGITSAETVAIQTLLSEMHYVPIDTMIENKTIEIRQKHKMKLPDAIILATAITLNMKLLTLDSNLAEKGNL